MSPAIKVGYVLKVFPRISETFVLNEILELERQGVEVEIFSLNPPSDPRYHSRLGRLNAPIHYLPKADSNEIWRRIRAMGAAGEPTPDRAGLALLGALQQDNPNGLKALLQGLYMGGLARSRGIAHLHAHFANDAARATLMAHRLTGMTFSLTTHAKDIYHQDRDVALLPALLDAAAFAVTVTDYNVDQLHVIHPAGDHVVRRVYNGLPLEEIQFSPVPSDGVPQIAAVGRLVEKKGFADLLEACAILRRRGRRFKCLIVGGGQEEHNLRRRHEALGLAGAAEFLGPRSHDDALEVVRQSRMVALPCVVGEDGNRDALPTALLEALALGRPAVSTELEGVTEIVEHNHNGLLVPQHAPDALADALDLLLSDIELCRRLGRAGRAFVEQRFDLSKNAGRLAQFFQDVVHGPRQEEADSHDAVPALQSVRG